MYSSYKTTLSGQVNWVCSCLELLRLSINQNHNLQCACRVAHLGCLGWRQKGGSGLIRSRFLLWSLLQAEAVSHVLLPLIYPFQLCLIQMSITLCLNKCPRVRNYLLEMSLQFLNKIWHLFSPSHGKQKPLPVSGFSSHSDSNIPGHGPAHEPLHKDVLWHWGPLKGLLLEKASVYFKQFNVAILSNFFRKAHAVIWCLFVLRKSPFLVHLHIQTGPCILTCYIPRHRVCTLSFVLNKNLLVAHCHHIIFNIFDLIYLNLTS